MTTPELVIRELPDRFLPEIAGGTKATVQLELTGEGGGRWWVRIADGRCTTGSGTAEKPDVVLRAAADDYVKIRLGQLDPVKATMAGRVTITGKYGIAVKFSQMFRTGE